jgi:hypothetical protein
MKMIEEDDGPEERDRVGAKDEETRRAKPSEKGRRAG